MLPGNIDLLKLYGVQPSPLVQPTSGKTTASSSEPEWKPVSASAGEWGEGNKDGNQKEEESGVHCRGRGGWLVQPVVQPSVPKEVKNSLEDLRVVVGREQEVPLCSRGKGENEFETVQSGERRV